MRRALIIGVSFLLAAGIIFSVFLIFNNRSFDIELNDLSSRDRVLSKDRVFTGKFKYEKDDAYICGYKSETENGILYIKLIASKNKSKALKTDENGYVDIRIDAEEKVSYVYYRVDKSKQQLAKAS